MNLRAEALQMLQVTSRTFYIPIIQLPSGLQDAVASAYLCMRAIDDIEDHPRLDNHTKVKLLKLISWKFQESSHEIDTHDLEQTLKPYLAQLPEVSQRIGEWANLAPGTIAPRIWEATSTMSDRMADWAQCNWLIQNKQDLDRYTFSVAGSVGLLLSDLWSWYDGTKTNRIQAIGFGRGLQAVNILRNHQEDLVRGVSFFPEGWTREQMNLYAHHQLKLGDAYTESLPIGPALNFCRIPLVLAHATLDVLLQGQEKLSRSAVMALVNQITTPQSLTVS